MYIQAQQNFRFDQSSSVNLINDDDSKIFLSTLSKQHEGLKHLSEIIRCLLK